MTEIAPGTQFSGTFTEANALAAVRLHFRPGRKLRIAIIVYLIVAALLIASEFYSGKANTLTFVLIGALVFVFILFFVAHPWRARRNFRQYKALQEPFTMEVRDTGLFFKRVNGEGLVPWSDVHKWKHNQELALIYPSSNIYHVLPASLFGSRETFGDFVETLRKRIGEPR